MEDGLTGNVRWTRERPEVGEGGMPIVRRPPVAEVRPQVPEEQVEEPIVPGPQDQEAPVVPANAGPRHRGRRAGVGVQGRRADRRARDAPGPVRPQLLAPANRPEGAHQHIPVGDGVGVPINIHLAVHNDGGRAQEDADREPMGEPVEAAGVEPAADDERLGEREPFEEFVFDPNDVPPQPHGNELRVHRDLLYYLLSEGFLVRRTVQSASSLHRRALHWLREHGCEDPEQQYRLSTAAVTEVFSRDPGNELFTAHNGSGDNYDRLWRYDALARGTIRVGSRWKWAGLFAPVLGGGLGAIVGRGVGHVAYYAINKSAELVEQGFALQSVDDFGVGCSPQYQVRYTWGEAAVHAAAAVKESLSTPEAKVLSNLSGGSIAAARRAATRVLETVGSLGPKVEWRYEFEPLAPDWRKYLLVGACVGAGVGVVAGFVWWRHFAKQTRELPRK